MTFNNNQWRFGFEHECFSEMLGAIGFIVETRNGNVSLLLIIQWFHCLVPRLCTRQISASKSALYSSLFASKWLWHFWSFNRHPISSGYSSFSQLQHCRVRLQRVWYQFWPAEWEEHGCWYWSRLWGKLENIFYFCCLAHKERNACTRREHRSMGLQYWDSGD
jgi:hypothetical protein